MIGKRLRKIISQLLLIFCILKKQKYVQLNSICKKQIIPLMIPNEEKEGWYYLAVKNYLHYFIE